MISMGKPDLAIVMTLCNRPKYTARVLDALAACDGADKVPVYLMVEPVNDEVLRIAKGFRQPCEVYMYTNRVGCNINTAYALAKGFENSDRVLALEDDTVPGRDLIRFITWALNEYEDDESVFSVCGYQRTRPEELHRTSEVVRENWFTPWGWATWRDRFESVQMTWPARNSHMSWDTMIHRGKLGDRCEIRPVVARVQNIGGELGLHVPSVEWHEKHHLNPHWIESTDSPPVGLYHEVAPTQEQLRVTYPC